MATRDRSEMFRQKRDTLRTHKRGPRTATELRDFKVDKNLLAPHSDDEGSLMDARAFSVPPVWVTLVDDMNRDISVIKIRISELNERAGKALLPGFGDDDDDQEELIAQTGEEVSQLFKDCEKRLKDLGRSKVEGSADEVRKNIERRVAQQLQDLGIEFRRGRQQYLAKQKGQKVVDYQPDLSFNEGPATSSGGAGFFDDEESAGGGDPRCDPRFDAKQTLELVLAEERTKERDAQITKVSESVVELAEIFKEIQVLVIDQGTVLDRIDYNIEQAADRVGNAVVELNKANEYQKKSRTMLCIYLLLLLCGFMVIVLILKKTALGS
uniref:t-SNARE coiled-coil homology domain-containing protein n=1 Tax=Haptolina brevifila TaxID=156173 RepID=A0A7S2DJZ6_9EUKA|mmetsp:Transcript_38748/g.77570  ORF Transcript_38748/g.77570 Transcript_38748/m.77570 type:complete len:325 (+) Transcript_38748:60-1034(+)|eukprot:CAMPEP_0174709140 /NCGR_PEP_ID=MMETSP1094-20130205/11194_1 /TAXON_ID=156173 /ORGANISM="Chrysochromulina brevifilum, Strain UTEX LB 985" /LENGTH=324 /DNA_ID=CAMNT_0015907791 /DNA_START=103 /DNA_END=1077 /DNA_ORIENTATION=+